MSMDPRMIPKGGSDEEFTDLEQRRNPNTAGVYYHEKADKFIETGGTRRPDGTVAHAAIEGSIQGDAFAQVGFQKATPEQAAGYQAQQRAIAEIQRIKKSRTTISMSSPGR